ncbi:TetR/AcrR family transcriptional regulator [Isoptericola sp. BMS4]|uniref:TetR/AcrR family transcriptional regulator n=1 Tax=Isoptericola sp. BMS4 TaxID=2527875 RepID=UPI00141E62C6|nr:TetR/AcrR family transcriptional regulator [Isoptericola sp. BMS4]
MDEATGSADERAVEAHVRRLWRHRGVAVPQPRRGPRRRLDVDAVLDAAVGVADADGLAAVSTRAVAARLGLSAMALYSYVGTKDQLLDLVVDHASALPAWEDPGTSAAADLTAWAERLLALHGRHPWLAERPWAEAPGGPHQQDWLERLLEILERWEVPGGSRAAVVTTLYAVVEAAARTAAAHARTSGADAAAWLARATTTRRLVTDYADRYPRTLALPQHADDWRAAPAAAVRHTVEVLCRGLGLPGCAAPSGAG